MRADARQNRDRIIEVARHLFAERGIDVPMAAVARRAGVGVATLYRRFPTRESLVTAVFADQFEACVRVIDDALTDPDPWRGFCTVIEKVCAMQARDRGFSAAFVAGFPYPVDFDAGRQRAVAGFVELTRRAQATGQLRSDFTPDDLVLLVMANSGLVLCVGDLVGGGETSTLGSAASRRLVGFLLGALHGGTAGSLPPPVPLGLDDVRSPAERAR